MATKNQSAGAKAAATRAANKAAQAEAAEAEKPVKTKAPAAEAPAKPAKAVKAPKAAPEEQPEDLTEGEADETEEGGTNVVTRDHIAADIREVLREGGIAISEKAAKAAVKAYEASVTGFLAGGNTINLPGFGKFSLKYREARQTRNPRTGEPVDVAASMVPAFKCGKALKDAAEAAFADQQ